MNMADKILGWLLGGCCTTMIVIPSIMVLLPYYIADICRRLEKYLDSLILDPCPHRLTLVEPRNEHDWFFCDKCQKKAITRYVFNRKTICFICFASRHPTKCEVKFVEVECEFDPLKLS